MRSISKSITRRRKNTKKLNGHLIRSIIGILNEYDNGIDRKSPWYKYNEDEYNRPFINTEVCTNKLFYILDILGKPETYR